MKITAALLFTVMFLQCLNTSLITVPLPEISDDLGITVSESSWLLLAYSIGTCALLLQFAKYSRNNRIRPFFLYGVGIFTFASFDCFVAKDYLTLVSLRFAQGASISLAAATGPVIVVRKMPERSRTYAMAMMGAGTGLAMVIGPSVGGILSEFISWHSLFLINVPLGLTVLAIAWFVIPKDPEPIEGNDPEVLGNIGWFIALAFGLMLLENVSTWSEDILFACGMTAFVGTVMVGWSMYGDKGLESVISLPLIESKTFKIIAMSAMLGSMITEGALYLLPYFMQISWGMGVTECGLYFCIVSVTTFVTAKLVGRYCDRHSSKGPVLAAFISTFVFDLIFAFIEPGWALALLVLSSCLVGVSFAVFETAQYLRIMRTCDPAYREESATLIIVLTYVGASLGLILYSLVFNTAIPEAAGLEISMLSEYFMTAGFHLTGVLGLVLGLIGFLLAMSVSGKERIEE